MFSFGGSELLIIVVLALLLFGPDKIPQLARTIGRFTREFNKYRDIMESTVRAEIYRAESDADKPEVPIGERIEKAAAAGTELRDEMAASELAASDAACEPGQRDVVAFTVTDEADEEEEE